MIIQRGLHVEKQGFYGRQIEKEIKMIMVEYEQICVYDVIIEWIILKIHFRILCMYM